MNIILHWASVAYEVIFAKRKYKHSTTGPGLGQIKELYGLMPFLLHFSLFLWCVRARFFFFGF